MLSCGVVMPVAMSPGYVTLQPNKDREYQLHKLHMTQVMFEQAKEDFEVTCIVHTLLSD